MPPDSVTRAVVWTAGASVVALVLGLVGGMLMLPVGLILDERVSWCLALVVAGLFAALGLWLVRLSRLGVLLAGALGTNLAYLAACVLVLALTAVLAAAQFRGGRRDLGRLARRTLSLIGAALIGVPAVVYVSSLFGLVGA
jgi:hypothetical protein